MFKKFYKIKYFSGLAWLWKTWQETAPGVAKPTQTRSRPQQQQALGLDEGLDDFESPGTDWRSNGQSVASSVDNYPGEPVSKKFI